MNEVSIHGSSSKAVESLWSSLPSNILTLIANKLNRDLDQGPSDSCGALSIHHLRLRSVCKSWRSILIQNKKLPLNILPFPILAHPKLNPNQAHFSLSQSTIYLIKHQENQKSPTKPIGQYWLLRVEKETSLHGRSITSGEQWRPLNPLSRTLTNDDDEPKRLLLPKGFPKSVNVLNFSIFEIGRGYSLDIIRHTSGKGNYFDEFGFVRIDKVVVSSSPFIIKNYVDTASEADYFVVMAICNLKLGLFKPGDEKWFPIEDPKDHAFLDVVFHKGKFYAVDYTGKVFSIEGDLKAKEIAPGVGYLFDGGDIKNLVTSDGDLFMIDTLFQSEHDLFVDDDIIQQPGPVRLKIYKLKEEKRKWEQVFNLNDHVFFVGYDCSYSVPARDFSGLKSNCVYYYVDDSYRDCDEENKLGEFFTGIGVYDMSVGSCGPLSNFPDHWPIFMPPSTLRCNAVVAPQWSHLPTDILTLVLNRLNNDLNQGSSDSCGALSIHSLRLRSVCKSWHSSIPSRSLKPTLSILPFPIFHHPNLSPNEGRFILSQSTIYLIQNQQNQISPTSSIGQFWLLRVEKETSSYSSSNTRGEQWRPLNPLSRTLTSDVDEPKRLLLPEDFPKTINVLNLSIFEIGRAFSLDIICQSSRKDNYSDEIRSFVRIDKVVVSSSPFNNENNINATSEVDYFVAMAICNLKLGFFKPGDEKWFPIEDPKDHAFLDVVFHKGKFYAVDYTGKVFSIEGDLKAKEIAPGVGYLFDGGDIKNLVTSDGDLFMIDTLFESEHDPFFDDDIVQQPGPVRLKIYKLKEEKRKWEQVFNLNDRVFFVGYDCSYSVPAHDFSGLKPNCVYYYVDDSFRDCNEENKLGEFFTGIGVYDMSVGSCGPLSNFPDHRPIFMPPSTLRKLKRLTIQKKGKPSNFKKRG